MVGPAGAGNVGFPTVGEGLRVPCGYVPSRSSSDPVPCPLPTDGRLYEAFSRRNARPYEARAVPCAIPNSEFRIPRDLSAVQFVYTLPHFWAKVKNEIWFVRTFVRFAQTNPR